MGKYEGQNAQNVQKFVDGTSALQINVVRKAAHANNLIRFPFADSSCCTPRMERLCAGFRGLKGCSYNRIERWQAVIAGMAFFILSLLSLLIGPC